ncbi:MAG: hypothetical protein O3C27_10240 [Actinomycetota bacterium]|nr:hypothetical protein [Actinomycetota bacterium]
MPADAVRVLERLADDELANLAEIVNQIQTRRGIAAGDHDAIIADAFELAFGGDGLGTNPWVQGSVIVCPGGIVSKSRSSHRCRFVSVNDTWVWDAPELIREDKRSLPGNDDGFRAVALVPVVSGMTLDVVSGKARSGMHQVDRVVSYKVRRGDLVEVAQRNVGASGMK